METRVIPTRVHGIVDYVTGGSLLSAPRLLGLDDASGAVLASSPWLFGFATEGSRYWLPHPLVGAFEVLVAATASTR